MRFSFALLILAGCTRHNPVYLGDGGTDDLAVADLAGVDFSTASDGGGVSIPVSLAQRNAIDLLFMLDNSFTMGPKHTLLQQAFPTLWAALSSQTPLGSFHIGVITSDLGAGMYTLGGGECHPGGDGAKLQPKGFAAAANCTAPVGANFVIDDLALGTSNLPPGQTVEQTFTCMSSVGTGGCGFESQLEAVYQALQSPGPVENAGFLRPESLLVVVLLTDGDDCSAPPTSDLFDQANTSYGALTAYRCYNYGVMCGTPAQLLPYNSGAFQMCRGATQAAGGKLYEVGRYTQFFANLKPDPNAVLLDVIAAAATPVQTILVTYPTTTPYTSCAGPPNTTSCIVETQHTCTNVNDATITGDPAVRIDEVLRSTGVHTRSSICDADYSAAMTTLAQRIAAARLGGCIGGVIDPTAPNCTVTVNGVPIAPCGQGVPCWRVVAPQPSCTYDAALQVQGLAAGATAQASCVVSR
jgi:hypothetical protein